MSDFIDDLCKRVELAARNNTQLRPVGGGTKNFYGGPLQGEEVDMRQWAGIVEYEPTELVITAKPGTPLAEVEAALAAQKQELAFEPPRLGLNGTIGGAIASGLAGPARLSRGGVKDYVLGCTLLDGKGQLLHFGGVVMKNVAGYDVSRLMAGAWGTLGLLTEVSLKVLPVAPGEATLRFDDINQADALRKLHAWGGQPLPLNASCWVQDGGVGTLYVRLRGAVAAVEAACERMAREAGGTRMDNAQAGPDWADCRDQRLPFFTAPAPDLALWRLSVAPSAPALELPWSQLIEWHGAQRWLWAPVDAAERLRTAAARAGGHATLFRAPANGLPEGVSRRTPTTGPLAQIEQRLREAFDPAGIFNAGKLA